MIPLGPEATDAVLSWSDGLHRTSALHHAAIHGRPGLWGDDRSRPSSAIWLREGVDQWEAFAAGFDADCPKPLRPLNLIQKIRTLLDSRD